MRKILFAAVLMAATAPIVPAVAAPQWAQQGDDDDDVYASPQDRDGYYEDDRDDQEQVYRGSADDQRDYERERARYERDRADYERRYGRYARNRDGYYQDRGYRGDYAAAPGNYAGQSWRGDDGRTYCRRSDGTTGLVVGGVGGALVGRAIDGGRNRGVGTILGAGAGALLGRQVERNGECR